MLRIGDIYTITKKGDPKIWMFTEPQDVKLKTAPQEGFTLASIQDLLEVEEELRHSPLTEVGIEFYVKNRSDSSDKFFTHTAWILNSQIIFSYCSFNSTHTRHPFIMWKPIEVEVL